MRAIIAETLESLDSYAEREAPVPEIGPGGVRIRVAACGVGYVDALVALGRYQVKPPLPHTPGKEAGGWVEAVGAGVGEATPDGAGVAVGEATDVTIGLATGTGLATAGGRPGASSNGCP